MCSDPENARFRFLFRSGRTPHPFGLSLSKPSHATPFGLSLSKSLLDQARGIFDEHGCRSIAAAGDSLSLASPRESKQREGDPQSGSLRFAPGTLRCSEQTEILETCLLRSLRTSKICNPSAPALLSPARTGGGRVRIRIRGALSPLCELNAAMFLVAAYARITWTRDLKY